MHLQLISAGAGSGKTYTLTQALTALLTPDASGKAAVSASGIIATTFTVKAAAELKERVRVNLLRNGLTEEADEIANAMIGTVHSIGVKLLKRFAFEAGVSPEAEIILEPDQQVLFNQSLSAVLNSAIIDQMEGLADQLGFTKSRHYDWRNDVRKLTEIARLNGIGFDALEKSKQLSLNSFFALLPSASTITMAAANQQLKDLLDSTVSALNANSDATAKKTTLINMLRDIRRRLGHAENLPWFEWVRLCKADPPKKCIDDCVELIAFANTHDTFPDFHNDIRQYITQVFDIAVSAMHEFEAYKKKRGLIDYTDMETGIVHLLNHPTVREVLRGELDLLLVDEFQDTSPIQMQIFLQLTQLAKQAIWVGDPKQSIYGFRGAAPELMEAVLLRADETKVLDKSWRSREDLVNMVNAIFTKAFDQMPEERVALNMPPNQGKAQEPMNLSHAIKHWHFNVDDGGKIPASPWFEKCIARSVYDLLESGLCVIDKETKSGVPVKKGDIAILCRSNVDCEKVAEALAKEGIDCASPRKGLLETAEARFVMACLQLLINPRDALAAAEILFLADAQPIEDIIDHRLAFLEQYYAKEVTDRRLWAVENRYIKSILALRNQTTELSCSEVLNLILEQLDIYRITASWGSLSQRHANIDRMRRMALEYEESCDRLHTSSTPGGFLLWLHQLASNDADQQPVGYGDHAVTVMTYHKSKGLEWPVTICHNLDNSMDEKLFGFAIVRETETIDLDKPLDGRCIRFWVNPYSDQSRNTTLSATLDAHPAKAAAAESAAQEEKRLLYVGITRARDYLILPTKEKTATKWLNRVWHGQEDVPALSDKEQECQWMWRGESQYKETSSLFMPRDFEVRETTYSDIPYIDVRHGEAHHEPLYVSLQSDTPVFKTGQVLSYAPPIAIPDDCATEDWFSFLEAFITADHPSYTPAQRLSIGEELIRYHKLEGVSVNQLLAYNEQLFAALSDNRDTHQWLRKYPVQGRIRGRRFESRADILINHSGGGTTIVLHSDGTGQQKLRNKALEEALRMQYIAQLLGVDLSEKQHRGYVHFPIEGVLVAVLP